MDQMVGAMFEKGLANLKRVTESRAADAGRQAQEILAAVAAGQAKQTLRVGDMLTPESVLYDAIDDVYLVSNINGSPFDTDDNGFIARVGTDGSLIETRWIDGRSPAA
jgi:hypothetical protein